MQVIVMQSVSGGGKSTWIRENFPEAGRIKSFSLEEGVVVSADHFFEKADGSYDFHPSQLPFAHGKCFRDFITIISAVCGDAEGTVIVDNTNTSIAELAPYCAAALAYGHELKIVTLLCDPNVAHARNTHGVPLGAVMGQSDRLIESQKQLPPWWAHEVLDNNPAT